jgi:NAD(P)-dependent dehydrogenase (short-subunit alcohol dehydrogenase family)
MINPMDLSGKHILITGASSGIGRETSITASQLGAKLSLVARSAERLNETLTSIARDINHAYSFDLRQLDGIENLIKMIVSENGPLDGLVNCAGIALNRPIKMVKPEFLQDVFSINFFPFVELVRAVTKKNMSNDGASFVGISSVAAFKGNKAQGAYAASKAATDAIIKPMAKELSERGIRVNTAAFGMIRTDMYKYFLDAGGDDELLKADQYLGVGEVEDAANVICFLLSGASRFITGTSLLADGGFLS